WARGRRQTQWLDHRFARRPSGSDRNRQGWRQPQGRGQVGGGKRGHSHPPERTEDSSESKTSARGAPGPESGGLEHLLGSPQGPTQGPPLQAVAATTPGQGNGLAGSNAAATDGDDGVRPGEIAGRHGG
ncbi:unnamed protein product, partial [Discosporangium mesarthrocarpum]